MTRVISFIGLLGLVYTRAITSFALIEMQRDSFALVSQSRIKLPSLVVGIGRFRFLLYHIRKICIPFIIVTELKLDREMHRLLRS